MGMIFQSSIDKHGMCKEDSEKICATYCRKFQRGECIGMRYIQTQDGLWTDQRKYPFPLYKEECVLEETTND